MPMKTSPRTHTLLLVPLGGRRAKSCATAINRIIAINDNTSHSAKNDYALQRASLPHPQVDRSSQATLSRHHKISQLIEQELELVTDGRLGVLYQTLPVGGVNLVEVPLQHLRYRRLALVAVPQQRLGRTHRLRDAE